MRDSIIILAVFALGVLQGRGWLLPGFFPETDFSLPALWVFMFLAGMSVGADRRLPEIMRNLRPGLLLLPIATTAGTLGGAAIAGLFLFMPMEDCLAVGAGFGYYSLSSIFITQYKGADLGTVALLANIIREICALLLMPFFVARFGPMPAIASSGCTSMDTTLPVITRYAGPGWILPALLHGIALDFTVPFWVTLFCSF